MVDLLRECNSGDLKTDSKTFQETWCARCSHGQCDLALFAKLDPMAVRNATWEDRYFRTPKADLTIPKFAEIAHRDFPNLLQKAMKLEISDRRGDWSVPEIPVLDGQIEVMPSQMTEHLDNAVHRLSKRDPLELSKPPPEAFPEDPPEPDVYNLVDVGEEDPDPISEPPGPLEEAPAIPPSRTPLPPPSGRNTFDPGEVMVGGAPSEGSRPTPEPEVDPWAPKSAPGVVIVKTGAKIQFGVGGKGKVVDD